VNEVFAAVADALMQATDLLRELAIAGRPALFTRAVTLQVSQIG
jgi:hypothetical protein